jgi:hypothetical protein
LGTETPVYTGVTGPNVFLRPLMELFMEPGAIRTANAVRKGSIESITDANHTVTDTSQSSPGLTLCLPTKWPPHGAKGRQCFSTPFDGAFACSLMRFGRCPTVLKGLIESLADENHTVTDTTESDADATQPVAGGS